MRAAILTIALFAASCAPSRMSHDCASSSEYQDEPAKESALRDREPQRTAPSGPITAIWMTRTSCLGACPAFTVVYRSDGTATYKGHGCVVTRGEHRGRLEAWMFERLAAAVHDIRFFELDHRYVVEATDQPATYVMVQTTGGRKVVLDYGGAAPARLWLLEEQLESAMKDVVWEGERVRVQKKAPARMPALH